MQAAGCRVIFASKNNRAVDVVHEKIKEVLGSDDWVLRLGSKKRIDEEKETRIEQAMSLTGDRSAGTAGEQAKLTEYLKRREIAENGSLSARAVVARYGDALAAFRRSMAQLPDAWAEWWDYRCPCNWPDQDHEHEVRRRLDDVRALSKKEWPGFWLWILRSLLGARLIHTYRDALHKASIGAPATLPERTHTRVPGWEGLQEDYEVVMQLYECRRNDQEVRSSLSTLEALHPTSEFKEDMEACESIVGECAQHICRTRIRNRIMRVRENLPAMLKNYCELTERAANPYPPVAAQIQKDFSRAANVLLSATPAVVVTSLAARRSLPSEHALFDYVIIDEASQCDIASAIPLLLRAKRLVVIGDPQQLRHVSSIEDQKEQELAQSAGATDLLSRYSYRKRSLFDCAAEMQQEAGHAPLFLAEHYRSHPEIIEFSNRTYYRPNYKAGLIVRTPQESIHDPSVLWHDVPSRVDRPRGSLRNDGEAKAVASLTRQIVSGASLRDGWTMGIVTPYKRQRNLIESLLQEEGLFDILHDRLRVGVVHTFQGSEADIMIFSPTVAEGADREAAEWISNEEGLLNVALTRARKVLHIVGDKAYCSQTRGNLGKLAAFVDELSGRRQAKPEDTEARGAIREMLKNLALWYQEEWLEERYHLDFMVVGLSGVAYDVEIDGRQHYHSAEAIAEDEARDEFLKSRGYKVIRFRAATVERYPDRIHAVLSRLA